MSYQDQDQKTEAPTGKRLDEARDRGQVPISRETTSWVSLLGILVVMGWLVPPAMIHTVPILRTFLELPHTFPIDEDNIQALFLEIFIHVGMAVGLIFLILMAGVIAGVMLQTGFFFALDLLSPDIGKLAPSNGFKKLFSLTSLVELGKSMCKMVLMGGIAFSVMAPVAAESPAYTGLSIDKIMGFLHDKVQHLIVMLLLIFTAIAAVDLFYTRWSYIKNLRMTKVEVKDEMKQQEGDPMIKGRLKQMRIEKARKRMMAQVPKADVIITNPTHYAIALQYDTGKMSAPTVIAKGINLIAERIRELGEQNRIPMVSNPPLARALFDTVEIDQQIPTQHYRAVAEVISYVYKLKKRQF